MDALLFLFALLSQAPDTAIAVIPRPLHVTRGRSGGPFVLTPGTVIVTDRATRDIGYQLADWVAPATGYRLRVAGAAGAAARTIALRLDPSLTRLGDEGYQLSVTARRITNRAQRPPGAFHAGEAVLPPPPADSLRPAPAVGRPGPGPRLRIG